MEKVINLGDLSPILEAHFDNVVVKSLPQPKEAEEEQEQKIS